MSAIWFDVNGPVKIEEIKRDKLITILTSIFPDRSFHSYDSRGLRKKLTAVVTNTKPESYLIS